MTNEIITTSIDSLAILFHASEVTKGSDGTLIHSQGSSQFSCPTDAVNLPLLFGNESLPVAISSSSEIDVIRMIGCLKCHKVVRPNGLPPSFKDSGKVLKSGLIKLPAPIWTRKLILNVLCESTVVFVHKDLVESSCKNHAPKLVSINLHWFPCNVYV